MKYWLLGIFGYLSGSIRYGYWIPKLIRGIDVARLSADNNAGAYNAYKLGGPLTGFLTLVCDLAKGTVPALMAVRFLDPNDLRFSLVLCAPVIGHAFPLGTYAKGGKAIAVSFGTLLGLYPELRPLYYLAAWYIILSLVLVINPHRLRIIIAYLAAALNSLAAGLAGPVALGCLFISAIVIYKHAAALANDPGLSPEQFRVSLFARHR